MKIEQLTLENFKCFKTEKTFDFSRLTILTGANSSGKSSVVNAILMMLQSEGFPEALSTNGDYVNLGDFSDIANDFDETKTISLTISFWVNKNRFKIASNWEMDKTNFLPSRKVLTTDRSSSGLLRQNFLFSLGESKTNFIGSFRSQPRATNFEKNKANFKIEKDGEGYLDQIVEWEKRGNGKMKHLIEVMTNLDLIEEIKIRRLSGGKFEILVKPISSQKAASLTNVGYGISQFMPIIVADLQLPDNSTLFLAEPEIHLHPSIQSKFGEYIVDKINKTEKNYVIETHSEYFLNRIRLAIVKGELKKEDVKVYFLENNKEDTDVYDIEFTKTGVIKNAPQNFFDTYFADSMAITLNAFAE